MMRDSFDWPAPAASSGLPAFDFEELIAAVGRRLHDAVSAQCIRAELLRQLHGEFAHARVTAYVPILLARSVCDALRGQTRAAGTRR